MLYVTGMGSTIVRELAAMMPEETIRRLPGDMSDPELRLELPADVPTGARFLFASGLIYSHPLEGQTPGEVEASLWCNAMNVARWCRHILQHVKGARICVVGSESAKAGSYDMTYAMGKAALHAFVTFQPITPGQQLCAVAPPIISDSNMVKQRHDYPAVLERRRHVTSKQVAEAVWRSLYHLPPFMRTNCVVSVGESEVCPWPQG